MSDKTGEKTIADEGVSFINNVWKSILVAIGIISRAPEVQDSGPTDLGTRLARDRTTMALNRTYLAVERTLQAWIRTALSMMSFGFTIGKIGEALHEVELKGPLGGMRTIGVQSVAYLLVILGTLSLMAASVQFGVRVNQLSAAGLRRRVSITFVVSLILILLGGFAFSALVMQL